MTTTACGGPGCDGAIEDGYCTVCGLAPAGGAAGPAGGSAARPAGPATSGSAGHPSGSTFVSRSTAGSGRAASAPAWWRSRRSRPATRPGPCSSSRRSRRAGGSAAPAGSRSAGPAGGRGHPRARRGLLPELWRPVLLRSRDCKAGELVAGQYEVLGCLAHGGLGWVYLARDRNVSDRWVVLKGLLELRRCRRAWRRGRRAAVPGRGRASEHRPDLQLRAAPTVGPGACRLHRHGVRQREDAAGRSLASRRRRSGESLPVTQALAYAIEVLPALGYLHRRGPGVLRLQARQRHPGRGALQAHRPRRSPADGRRRRRRSTGPSATRRRRSPPTALARLRPLHGRSRSRRARLPVHRLHQQL